MIKSYFNNIEDELSAMISAAERRVLVAVAWFTNERLFEKLNKALQRNIEIKILMLDDILNRSEFGLDYGVLANNGADIRYSKNNGGTMHNKFCIIDDKVITGSYNWTNHANVNDENIVVIEESDVVNSYNDQFEKLFSNGDPISLPYEHVNWTDVKEGDFSELRRNIFRDVVAKNDENRELKRIKLLNLNQAYKSGDIEEIKKASSLSVEGRLRTITDVLTSRYHDYSFRLWEENILGKPYDNVDGHIFFEKWFFIPYEITEDKYHFEYIEGTLKTIASRNDGLAKGLKLSVYDHEYITTIKRILGTRPLTIDMSEEIPDRVLRIDYARMCYYQFPSPLFNKRQPKTWKNSEPRLLKGINVLAIAKSVDGDNVEYYEGWDPMQRGEKIAKELFVKEM